MKLPLSTFEKAWIETRTVTLCRILGAELIRESETVLPSSKYNDKPISISELLLLGETYCERIGFDPTKFTISSFVPGRGDPPAVTHEATGAVELSSFLLANEQDSVATLLSFLTWLWLRDMQPRRFDESEWLWIAELVPVYLGWGIFGANTTVYAYSASDAYDGRFEIQRPRHMPARMYGYAMALHAWAQSFGTETRGVPEAASALRPDASRPLVTMYKYVVASGDSYFHPNRMDAPDPLNPEKPGESFDIEFCRELLTAKSSSMCLAAMLRLATRPQLGIHFTGELVALLERPDKDVREYALRSLMPVSREIKNEEQNVAVLLNDSSDQVRSAAVTLLGLLLPRGAPDNHRIIELMSSGGAMFLMACISAIRQFVPSDGEQGKYLAKKLLDVLRRALVDGRFDMAMTIGETIKEVVAEPEEKISLYFDDDPDLREQALEMLQPDAGIHFFDDVDHVDEDHDAE